MIAPLENSVTFKGDSMSPFLRTGDKILIDNSITYNFEIGDILFFKIEDEFIIHRLVTINKTKGDRSKYFDSKYNFPFLVTGIIRQNKIIYWNKKGHIGKRMMAFLSNINNHLSPYIIQKISVILIIVSASILSFLFALKSKKINT